MHFADMFVYYSVRFACCMFYCVDELFVECVCYLYRCSSCFVAQYLAFVPCLGRPLFGQPIMVFEGVCVICYIPSCCPDVCFMLCWSSSFFCEFIEFELL